MMNVLFVDDEPYVLQAMARMLHPLRGEWQMTFVSSPAKALEALESRPCDVLVSDMRMPGMGGAQLLAEVSRRYPDVVRIVLSGMCDRQEALASVAGAHQFLAKPCDASLLRKAVERALSVKAAGHALKGFVSRIVSLPSLPSLYGQLVEAAQDPDVSTQKIGAIVARDLAMTSKVLHIVNSPLFGLRRRILSPADACVFLGIDTLQTLVLSLGVFSQFARQGHFAAEDLQEHSLHTANASRRIAQSAQLPKETIEECFLAGMLHDLGKLVMAVNCPQDYDRCVSAAQTHGRLLADLEQEIFGVTHADAGMYLMRLWGMPDGVAEAVALHHEPGRSSERRIGPLAIVHAADALVRNPDAQAAGGLDLEYLTAVRATSDLAEWSRLAGDAASGVAA